MEGHHQEWSLRLNLTQHGETPYSEASCYLLIDQLASCQDLHLMFIPVVSEREAASLPIPFPVGHNSTSCC